jgi:putative hydrolase of the HAD superfamily
MNDNVLSQNKNQQDVQQIAQLTGQVTIQPALQHEKYKNIIFDLGAVLFYFNPYENLHDLFGLNKEQAAAIVKNISGPVWLDMDRGVLTPEQVACKLEDQFNKDDMMKFLNAMPERLVPIELGVRILNQVRQKGYKTYVLSNLAEFCYLKVKDYDFVKRFDGAIYSYQHGCAKPEAQIYKTLLSTYSLKAEECLFIDDLEVNINSSKSLGIDGIVCKDHDYVLDQLKLLKIL